MVVRMAPETLVLTGLVNNKLDTLPVLLMQDSMVNTFAIRTDTIFLRDTIFLEASPMAILQPEASNLIVIRDTTIIEKTVLVEPIPDEASVFLPRAVQS